VLIQSRADSDDVNGIGHGDDSNDDSIGDGEYSSRNTQPSRLSSSTFVKNVLKTNSFSSTRFITRKTQLLTMLASLSCSLQALHCDAVIKQALKEVIQQAYKQNIKQASD
jgi:hypothetical protein